MIHQSNRSFSFLIPLNRVALLVQFCFLLSLIFNRETISTYYIVRSNVLNQWWSTLSTYMYICIYVNIFNIIATGQKFLINLVQARYPYYARWLCNKIQFLVCILNIIIRTWTSCLSPKLTFTGASLWPTSSLSSSVPLHLHILSPVVRHTCSVGLNHQVCQYTQLAINV